MLQLVEAEMGRLSVSSQFSNCEDDFCWLFTGVYGLTRKREKENFGKSLGLLKGYGLIHGVELAILTLSCFLKSAALGAD